MTRSLGIVLSASLLASTTILANASGTVTETADTYTIANSLSEQLATTVETEVDSMYSVTIPKLITVTNLDSVQYTVSVSGDIAGYERIHVEPDSTVTLSQPNKESIEATISQPIVDFRPNNWTGTFTETDGRVISTAKDAKDPINATGTISSDTLTAGTWTGKFNFNIERIGYINFTLTRDNMYMTGILTDEQIEQMYNIDEDGNYVIKQADAYVGNNIISGVINIPETFEYDGKYYRTVSIGEKAFTRYYYITDINIPSSVATIGSLAFIGCNSLTSITIPNNVTSIGPQTFMSCANLTDVIIEDGGTLSIQYNTFQNCTSLSNVYIGDGTKYIGRSVFNSCTSLKTIYIPSSVTEITGSNVYTPFMNCSSDLKIYCGADKKPSRWDNNWNYYTNENENDADNRLQVEWGITREQYEQEISK